MGVGQLQRAGEVARWSQIYGILEGANGQNAALLTPEVRKGIDKAYFEDTGIYNGTSTWGLIVFITSGVGLILSFRAKKN